MQTERCAMYSIRTTLLGSIVLLLFASAAYADSFGRPVTQDEIALWDIDVRPDGAGLPAGKGTVAEGKQLFDARCAVCHGTMGQGALKDKLVGGQGTLASDTPVKTVGSYWPYATTLFDYIRRAMPYPAPGTLNDDETYALAAYILYLNGLAPSDGVLDKESIPKVKMPNRDGFIPDPVFKID
jgi:S-disulfanyl-L-cysteine oxidoreductase SoxD